MRDTQESFTEYYDGDRENIPDEYRVFGTAEKSEEKTSVLKDLKEKQKETSVKAQVKDTVEKTAKSKGGEAL